MTGLIRKSEAILPPLPFGRDRATVFQNAAVVSRAQTESNRTNIEYTAEDRATTAFGLAFATLRSPTLHLVATASTAMQYRCEDAPGGIILVPFRGTSTARQGSRTVEWGQDRGAVYLPPGSTTGQSQSREVIGIDIVPDRIQRVAQVMLGQDSPALRPVDLASFRALDMQFGKVDFAVALRQYVGMIDAMGCQPARLENSGLADMILRTCVMLMAPKLFLDTAPETRTPGQGKISKLCEYIDANLHNRLTLTDLERLSGLSARGLQYAFRRATGRTPMQWVGDRRLQTVRAALLSAKESTTVTAIASPYFSNLGDFANAYRKRFGEPPSRTLHDAVSSLRLR